MDLVQSPAQVDRQVKRAHRDAARAGQRVKGRYQRRVAVVEQQFVQRNRQNVAAKALAQGTGDGDEGQRSEQPANRPQG